MRGKEGYHLRIFLSSPDDVRPERERAETIICGINAGLDALELELVRWEANAYSASGTFQDQITNPGECDLVVCLFWKRLGSALPPAYNREDGTPRTGTEYEFEEAIQAARQHERKVPDIFVYRKVAPVQFSEGRVDQERAEKLALDAFWAHWFKDEEGHFLAAFDTFLDTDEFARRFERHLKRWLEERREADWDIAQKGSPFRGLEPFDEKHASVFFGRRRTVEHARARLMAAAEQGYGSLFVLGASGSGKSSLVRAGLVPRLLIPDSTKPIVERWRRVVVTPLALGTRPVVGLCASLLHEDVLPELREGDYPEPEQLGSLLARNPHDGVRPLQSALERWSQVLSKEEDRKEVAVCGLLIVADQIEEVFQFEPRQREEFLGVLNALAEADRIWLITTMRSDFYPLLQSEPVLLAIKERSRTFDLSPPTQADVREMVEGAARAADLNLEDDGERSLAGELERDANVPGSLPMLQFALQALFEAACHRESNTLLLADYDRLGGAAGALATEAERLLLAMGEQGAQALPAVLRRLVNIQGPGGNQSLQARVAPHAAFMAGSAERELVDLLLKARLLVAFGQDQDASPQVRVAHEKLFECWPRVARQIAADRRDLETRTRLEWAQTLWVESERNRDRLLTSLALEEGRDLARRWGAQLPRELLAFIAESGRRADTLQRKKRVTVIGIMTALIMLAASATWFGFKAEQERHRTERESYRKHKVEVVHDELLRSLDPREFAPGILRRLSVAVSETEDGERLASMLYHALEQISLVDVVRDVLVVQVLTPTLQRTEEEFADDPEILASLRSSLSLIFHGWGLYEEAVRLSMQAIVTWRDLYGEGDPATLVGLSNHAMKLRSAGRLSEAAVLGEQVLEAARQTLGAEHVYIAWLMSDLAQTLSLLDDLAYAEALARPALEMYRREAGIQHDDYWVVQKTLWSILVAKGDVAAAEALAESALDEARYTLGAHHPLTLRWLSHLAQTRTLEGDLERARALQEQVLEIRRRTLGPEHLDTFWAALNLVSTLTALGEREAAFEIIETEFSSLLDRHPGGLDDAQREIRGLVELLIQDLR